MNVLIVDDSAVNLKLLRAVLDAEGITVRQALDGVEALAVLDREPVDAIISDVLMPRMDGYRLCYEVRQSERWRKIPFIFYTATYTAPSDEKLSTDLGADKYLKKPASPDVILAALREVFDGADRHRVGPHKGIDELSLMKEYSERLVAKLEERNIQLTDDVTARRHAEEDLRATHAQLRHLLEHSPGVLYALKVNGADAVPYLVSGNITALLGFTVEQALSCQWWTGQLHPEERDRVIAAVAETLARGASRTEYRLRHKDGSYRWIEDHRSVVRNGSGPPQEVVGLWTSIDERKKTQQQMLRSQRLESIGTLAGGVAHDLNNALAPILMGTELMRLEFPDTASDNLDIIQASARRGAAMVKQLLTFAKGTEGERLLIQPRYLFREMEQLIRSTFPRNIRLQVNCAEDLRTIRGDATQLHQVLLNLCVNARDAMPAGGTLSLRVEDAEMNAPPAGAVGEARPGSYICWRVSDTGTGIPLEVLDHIFEPFFTTKGPDKGTGLGLSTVIGIVKSHGGFLDVHSAPGQGSTFAVYLPAAGPGDGPASLESKAAVPFRGSGQTVLVVDDEPAVRDVEREVLTRLGFKVLTASDGAAALVQVAELGEKLHAILTDFHMPHLGLAFLRVLKARIPAARIIVVTGQIEGDTAAEIGKLGVSALLQKPFTQEALITALRKAFQP